MLTEADSVRMAGGERLRIVTGQRAELASTAKLGKARGLAQPPARNPR